MTLKTRNATARARRRGVDMMETNPPPPADEGTHGEERPSGDHLQRMESNVQRPGSQYSASTEDEVVTAEIVEELTRRVDSYLWSAPAPSPETLEA